MESKTCKTCQKILDYNNFYQNKGAKDGYVNECKYCKSKKNKLNYKSSFITKTKENLPNAIRSYLTERSLLEIELNSIIIKSFTDLSAYHKIHQKITELNIKYLEESDEETNIFTLDIEYNESNIDLILSHLSIFIVQRLKKIISIDDIQISEKGTGSRVTLPFPLKKRELDLFLKMFQKVK